MVHLLVVAVLELDATDTTLADLLSHLKLLCIITALNHTTLPGKITLLVDSCKLCGFEYITDVTT